MVLFVLHFTKAIYICMPSLPTYQTTVCFISIGLQTISIFYSIIINYFKHTRFKRHDSWFMILSSDNLSSADYRLQTYSLVFSLLYVIRLTVDPPADATDRKSACRCRCLWNLGRKSKPVKGISQITSHKHHENSPGLRYFWLSFCAKIQASLAKIVQ